MASLLENKLAVPIGLLIALVLSVGVWFVPLPISMPGERSTGGGGSGWSRLLSGGDGGGEVARASVEWTAPEAVDLSDLTATLTALREPPPEAPAVAEEEVEEIDEGEPVVEEVEVTLDWSYQGSVVAGASRAAMVQVGDAQRFLFEGETVDDPLDPTDEPVVVKSVGEKVLIAETQGVEVRIPLMGLSPEERDAVMGDAGSGGSVVGGGDGGAMAGLVPPRVDAGVAGVESGFEDGTEAVDDGEEDAGASGAAVGPRPVGERPRASPTTRRPSGARGVRPASRSPAGRVDRGRESKREGGRGGSSNRPSRERPEEPARPPSAWLGGFDSEIGGAGCGSVSAMWRVC